MYQPAEVTPDTETTHPARQLTAAAGLYGVDATNATTLLTQWKERQDGAESIWALGAQAPLSSVNLETLLEEEDEEAVGSVAGSGRYGSTKSAGGGTSRRKLRLAKGQRFTKSAAHVRHSVTAKRISVQLINVS